MTKNSASRLSKKTGIPVDIIDLQRALARPENEDSILLDAYLQLDTFNANPHELLDFISKRIAAPLRTHFVRAELEVPKSNARRSLQENGRFKGV